MKRKIIKTILYLLLFVIIYLILVFSVILILRNKTTKPQSKILTDTIKSSIERDSSNVTRDSLIINPLQSQTKLTDTIKETAKPQTKEITQQKKEIQNPLDVILKNKKPTVLDLGSKTCIPCKMMKAIFDELEKDYKDRANLIILDVYEYRDLSSKYQVRVIPTQIFFDKTGNQNWRHEGFLAKEEILKKLKELGME